MTLSSGDQRPWVVIVGGFLGAGKTSLIVAAAQLLRERGLRTGIILNDQGRDLVDTLYAEAQTLEAREVTGGCFCCRFSELLSRLEDLRTSSSPDVIFAEPVGSCMDIAATVLRPLQEEFAHYRLAPFTVLVDPLRSTELLRGTIDPNVEYLLSEQVKEADIVCVSKTDVYHENLPLLGSRARYLSAKTGQGVKEWVSEVFSESIESAANALSLDYERYARAEAALAWLNLSFTFEPQVPLSPASVIGPFLDAVDRALTAAGIRIVHLKLIDRSPVGWLKAAICRNGDEPIVDGPIDASPAKHHELLLNLRAVSAPAAVADIVRRELQSLAGATSGVRLECFAPAAPVPERRIVDTDARRAMSPDRIV